MTNSPDNTGKKQGKFSTGESGNPAGRPKGSRNRTTLAMQSLLEGEGEKLTRKAVELALAGDTTALRLCLERVLPPRKDSLITFTLPTISCADDIPKALGGLIAAVSSGDLTPLEAQSVSTLMEQLRRSFETAQLERKLEALTVILNNRK